MDANATTLPDTQKFETFLGKRNLEMLENNKKIAALKTTIKNSRSDFKITSFKFKNTPVVISRRCLEHQFNGIFHQTQENETKFLITEINLWYKEFIDKNLHTTSCLLIEYKFNKKGMSKTTGFSLFHDSDLLKFGENSMGVSFEFNFENAKPYNDFMKKIDVFKEIKKQYLF